MAATRRRGPDTLGRARGAAVAASGRRETARGGEAEPFRWLGRLDGAGPPVNSAPFLFFNFSFPKSLNTNFEGLAKFSELGVKRENVPNKILYNFALKCNPKF